ncbi:hypothetical protein D9613_012958 [Agrocybe pediades]|uniref:Uncharacterized protein n=1 Tax=Agrocybe pediades TaxID=84607 RepID=A0A8H4QW83_9AGAR|nr:hypothetical protein D9613_012958 [Agrocybe pediades]
MHFTDVGFTPPSVSSSTTPLPNGTPVPTTVATLSAAVHGQPQVQGPATTSPSPLVGFENLASASPPICGPGLEYQHHLQHQPHPRERERTVAPQTPPPKRLRHVVEPELQDARSVGLPFTLINDHHYHILDFVSHLPPKPPDTAGGVMVLGTWVRILVRSYSSYPSVLNAVFVHAIDSGLVELPPNPTDTPSSCSTRTEDYNEPSSTLGSRVVGAMDLRQCGSHFGEETQRFLQSFRRWCFSKKWLKITEVAPVLSFLHFLSSLTQVADFVPQQPPKLSDASHGFGGFQGRRKLGSLWGRKYSALLNVSDAVFICSRIGAKFAERPPKPRRTPGGQSTRIGYYIEPAISLGN